jgi:outer membrane protein assembly factor BamB
MRDVIKLAAFAIVPLGLATCGTSGATGQTKPAAQVQQAAAGTIVAATVQGGADWPQYRGPNTDGISPEKGINKNWAAKPPKMLWKVDLTDGGYSGPAVSGGMVYIIDHEGDQDIVRALSLADGQEAWRYAYGDTDQGNYGYARSTPTVSGGKVYTVSRLGVANCLNAKTGDLVWTRNVVGDYGSQRPQWDLAHSPVIDGQKLILCPGGQNAGMVALDKDTGKTLWQGGGTTVSGYSTPVIATIGGVRQYVVTIQKGMMGVDPQTGKVLWNAPWETGCDVNAANPIVMGNNVYISSGYGHGCGVYAVSGSNATKVWENKAIQAHFSSAILSGGYIFGTGDPGFLVCLNPKNGQVMWQQKGFEKGGVVGVDGTVIALDGSNGDVIMAALSPAGYKELGRLAGPLGGQSWTAPIVAQGKLIIRNKKSIACLDLR